MPKRRVRRHEVIQPLDQSYRLIPLTQGQNAIVDTEDFERLTTHNWYASWNPCTESFYAFTWNGTLGRKQPMPDVICNEDGPYDHRNFNTLDNRKENLRQCSRTENNRNRPARQDCSSGFKGVGLDKRRNVWRARIVVNKVEMWLGYFSDPKEAARAYDEAAKLHYGEFASLNFQDKSHTLVP
jgi:hypothetical protein